MKKKSPAKQPPAARELGLHVLRETPPWEWPKSAPETFKAVLTNTAATESDRILAAELAGDFVAINDDLAETLLKILADSNESEQLRGRAAISFGAALEHCDLNGFDDPYDTPPITEEVFQMIQIVLKHVYDSEGTPKLVKRRCLEAAVRAQEPWQSEAVRRAYESQDPDWMLTAVFCMGYLQGFEKEILEALQSPNELIHREAVEAAGEKEIDQAWKHVYQLLEHAERVPKALVLAAIGAVANIRQDTPSLEILNHLVDSDDKEISDAADEALSLAGAYTEFDEDDLDDGDASGWIN